MEITENMNGGWLYVMKLLFQLCLLDIESYVIHETLLNAIMKDDISISKMLYGDIFLLTVSLSSWALLTGSEGCLAPANSGVTTAPSHPLTMDQWCHLAVRTWHCCSPSITNAAPILDKAEHKIVLASISSLYHHHHNHNHKHFSILSLKFLQLFCQKNTMMKGL